MHHTPGPWEYRVDPDLDDNIAGPNSEQLARVYCTDTNTGMANAKLIAAAPELLEALTELVWHVDYCGWGDKWERECAFESGLPAKVWAAIAKAEGE